MCCARPKYTVINHVTYDLCQLHVEHKRKDTGCVSSMFSMYASLLSVPSECVYFKGVSMETHLLSTR